MNARLLSASVMVTCLGLAVVVLPKALVTSGAQPSSRMVASADGTPQVVHLPMVFRSLTPWTVIATMDFEGAFPGSWTVDDKSTTGGQHYWGKRSCQHYGRSYSGWASGGGSVGSGLSCGTNYPDNLQSWMVYGPFSLADATAASLSLKLWQQAENTAGSPPKADGTCLLASTDNTHFHGNCLPGTTGGWVDYGADLSNANGFNVLRQSSVWVAVVFASDGSVNFPFGAYIDDVLVRKCTASSCVSTGSPLIVGSTSGLTETPAVGMRRAR